MSRNVMDVSSFWNDEACLGMLGNVEERLGMFWKVSEC